MPCRLTVRPNDANKAWIRLDQRYPGVDRIVFKPTPGEGRVVLLLPRISGPDIRILCKVYSEPRLRQKPSTTTDSRHKQHSSRSRIHQELTFHQLLHFVVIVVRKFPQSHPHCVREPSQLMSGVHFARQYIPRYSCIFGWRGAPPQPHWTYAQRPAKCNE